MYITSLNIGFNTVIMINLPKKIADTAHDPNNIANLCYPQF